jgi:dolichyl-phosphate-mannose-protein mannosyltransferase
MMLRQRVQRETSPQRNDIENDTEEKIKPEAPLPKSLPKSAGAIASVLLLLALFTRLYTISEADFVVWDEAHFGKFASRYLKRKFYHDVHPPLGKMLNALAGWIGGYHGDFKFESGATYPSDVNYFTMRFVNGLSGAAIVPLAYYTGLHLQFSHAASILLAVMVLCDSALTTISRFILLDAFLMFFTVLSAYCFAVYYRCQREK